MIGQSVRAVVLVEGPSDQFALHVLARRCGLSLRAAGAAVVSMGGATNIGHHLDHYGPQGRNLRLAGLCDSAEEDLFRRTVQRADIGTPRCRTELAALGFGVCVADLEDELIRAVGVENVMQILATQREPGSFRTLQRQLAQRGRDMRDQLRRFISGRSGNKKRYAGLLAAAVHLDRVPAALRLVLAHVTDVDSHP